MQKRDQHKRVMNTSIRMGGRGKGRDEPVPCPTRNREDMALWVRQQPFKRMKVSVGCGLGLRRNAGLAPPDPNMSFNIEDGGRRKAE